MTIDLAYEVITRNEFESARDGQRAFRNERYKPKRKNLRGGIRATLLDMPICAIDGEGKTTPDGKHRYCLLCASWGDGRAKIEAPSLSFEQCADFVLRLPANHVYVIFGGNYDVNMILSKIPFEIQDRLLDTGTVGYKGYRLKWIERKFFSIRKNGQTRILYDVLANFQKPFVQVCEAWECGTPEQREIVRRMKEQRGDFAHVDDDAIEDYCYLECVLLRDVCRKFFDAILQTPYRPRAVYGPGALAAAAMEKHNVKRCMAVLDTELDHLTRYAYFGGRFDCSVLGWFTDVWQYDIKSAYPDQIRYLPCLKHGTWQRHSYADWKRGGLPEWGMCQVEWHVAPDSSWPPFPHRDSKGNVYYPYKGKGWYHANEIRAAIEMYGDAITYVTGWRLETNCKHRPFDFVDELFEIRKTMAYEQGIVIKLILNSLYGKLAQQVGAKYGKRPTFQCFFWAGAITAGTRAKLLRAIAQRPDSVLGVATDGIVAARELDLEIGPELGQWDAKHLRTYAQISNGVYNAIGDDGKQSERARGFGRANLDWEKVRRDYLKSRGVGYTQFTAKGRFIGIREARTRIDRRDVQCTWIRQDRQLSFWPARRFPGKYDKRGPTLTIEPVEPQEFESQPFRLKEKSTDVIEQRERWNAYAWQDYA